MRSIAMVVALAALATVADASGPFHQKVLPHAVELDSVLAAMEQQETVGGSENVRLVSTGLAVLLGPFAAHRLYMGTTPKVAMIYGLTFGGFGILVLLDLGHLLFTKDLDRFRNSDRVFMWGKPDEGSPPTPTPP